MSILMYILCYLALFASVAITLMKIVGYLKKPDHLRWELYPVPHETDGRAAYGGSYMEKTEWWKSKQQSSFIGTLLGFLKEATIMHASFEHNRCLWYRTYPFHLGIYVLAGSLALSILCGFMSIFWVGWFFKLCLYVTLLCNLAGYLGVFCGSIALILRRLQKPDLKKFSMPEHFFNLALFAVFSGLGLLLTLSSPFPLSYGGFAGQNAAFFRGMMTFTPQSLGFLYTLYLLVCCLIFIWVPYSFMGHVFMKFFTWHDIRWNDIPTQDSEKQQAGLMDNLMRPVSWSADHIEGDGKKNWAEVATTPPHSAKKV